MRARIGLALLVLQLVPPAAAQQACPPYRAGQTASWARDAVFYEVFVRSFADSDGDGVGDFRGLTKKLDYLNDGNPATDTDLGVTALWLMPITRSPSYHGYDTTDYDRVDQEYGTEEDFASFLAEAHKRGIRVIIDLVVNHASAQHPWFVEASSSVDSPKHGWFSWSPTDPGWKQPWGGGGTWHHAPKVGKFYYGLFWGGMPDLNYENPEVRREMTEIALRWLRKGVDGFRLDASRHIIEAGAEEKVTGSPETHAWWREFAAAVRKEFPEALLVGENWTGIEEVAEYFGQKPGEQLDMSFNFDLAGALVQGAANGSAAPVRDALCQVARHYPPHALDATFLTNHDMIRVMTQVAGDVPRARLAAGLLLTLPGVPFLYYGEEIGLKNGSGRADEEKRTPMQWTPEGGFTTGQPWRRYQDDLATANVQTQEADLDSLLWHYRRLVQLRRSNPALSSGRFELRSVRGPAADSVLAFERLSEGRRVLVVANLGSEPQERLELDVPGLPAGPVVPVYAAPAAARLEAGAVAAVPPHSVLVFDLGQASP